jgi:ubiquinone/menaquinone biosynthesis C-methylase UbiE
VNSEALVLDAGGGTGRWTIRMAKKARKAVLMDLSEGMLKVAADRIKSSTRFKLRRAKQP